MEVQVCKGGSMFSACAFDASGVLGCGFGAGSGGFAILGLYEWMVRAPLEM